MKLAAVILAAGSSSRFEDGHKLLAEIGGIPMIRRVCVALADANVAHIVLVTREIDGAVTDAAGRGRWRTIANPHASQGLSTSLRTGIENIPRDSDGVLIALGDMPGITPQLANALIATFEANRNAIAFPVSADGKRGHPIIWPRSLFSELETLTGDTGGKSVLADHKELWLPVRWESGGAFADIDTRADLASFGKSDFDAAGR